MSDDGSKQRELVMWILNAAWGVAFACIGLMLGLLINTIQEQDARLDNIPVNYVIKADYIADRADFAKKLDSISAKLDHTAEYIEADYNRRMDKIEKLLNELLSKSQRADASEDWLKLCPPRLF